MAKYTSFSELKQCERDFSIDLCDRGSTISILAPHGGRIEPHTTEIARLVAGIDCNLFCFNGSKQSSNQDLHITSHLYDEEQALALVERSYTVIAIHGCTKREPLVYLGGRDMTLISKIAAELAKRNIPSQKPGQKLRGLHELNICNRGITGRGVQLEISRHLRDSPAAWIEIASAVRSALAL